MIKCFGTVYRLHPLLVIMMALSVWLGCFVELITLFGIVTVHELGHAVAARSYGWKVSEIKLLPFGGVMVVEEQDGASSIQEIVVALCGPLQNAVMIGAALLLKTAGLWEAGWADYFIQANIWIALFNLLPVLPLDGGRIVQALMHRAYAYYRIIIAGAWAGMLISAVMAVIAFLPQLALGINVNLLMIAIFLLLSNWYGYKHAHYRMMRFLIGRDRRTSSLIGQGRYAQPVVVSGSLRPYEAAKLLVRERHHLFYVLREDGSIRSIIPERMVIRQLLSDPNRHTAEDSSMVQ